MAEVEAGAAGAPIGRPHIAQALVDAGVTSTSQEAFDQFLGIGRSCFVPKRLPRAEDAITAIHRAGGAAVAAHPGSSRVHDVSLGALAAAGLDGVEVRHPKHGTLREGIVLASCQRLGLLPSGGSDFHGPGRGDSRLGQHTVSMEWAEALRARARRHRISTSV